MIKDIWKLDRDTCIISRTSTHLVVSRGLWEIQGLVIYVLMIRIKISENLRGPAVVVQIMVVMMIIIWIHQGRTIQAMFATRMNV